MAWIESHQELRNHPKLSAVCRTLSAEKTAIIGSLHCLWWWCMDYAMDGDVSRFNAQQIADAADWKGDAEAFVKALLDAGFMEQTESGRTTIHDWFDFCGELIHKRLRRKEEKRQKSADIVRRNPPKSAEKPPTVPNRTVPDLTLPTPTAQPKKRPSGPVGPADPEVAKLTDLFLELLKAKSGDGVSFPVVRARKFFKTMLKTNTSLHLATTIRNYFDSTDTFIKNSGYSWGSFDIKFNALKGGPIHAGTNKAGGNNKNRFIPNQSVVEDGSIYNSKMER